MTLRSARTLSRFSGLALIAAGTMAALSTGTFCYWRFGWIRLICPIGFVEASLSSGTIYWSLIGPFLVVLGLVVLLGRVFCSWLCPSHLVVSHIARLVKRGASIGIMKWTLPFQARLAGKLPVLDSRDGLALLPRIPRRDSPVRLSFSEHVLSDRHRHQKRHFSFCALPPRY